MEHVAVNIAVAADKMPGDFGVGDAEVLLFLELELSKFDGVGVAGIEDDLDDIDFDTTLHNLKIEAEDQAGNKTVYEIKYRRKTK